MYDYVKYVSRLKDNKKKGMDGIDAVTEAVDWAIKENLLDGYFKEQKEEVLAMSLTEFDAEEVTKDLLEEGREIGREEGLQQKAIEAAQNALSMQLPAETASKISGLPIEKVLELQAQLLAQA